MLKRQWLEKPDDLETVQVLSELMGSLGRADLAGKLARLCQSQSALRQDGPALFEAGFQLIDERQPELAVMLLSRCAELSPEDPTVNYELGFALMSLKRYRESLPYFQRALAKHDDFDTRLNLCVAYTCMRRPHLAQEMLERMSRLAASDQESQEVAQQRAVLKRLEALSSKASLTARDWLYIHYGSILLSQNREAKSGGKFGPTLSDYAQVAKNLLLLRGVLEGLGSTFEVVEFYSSLSRPLAQALAELLGLPAEHYKGQDRQERALLVMAWAGDIIGPHESFVANRAERSLYAAGLTWREPLPLTPEIVGCLAEAYALPWTEKWRVESGRFGAFEPVLEEAIGGDQATAKLIDKASTLEADPDILHEIEELLSYYGPLRNRLVIGNHERFPNRPQYTCEGFAQDNV